MREILFRGKTITDVWVYGDLLNGGYDYHAAIREKHDKAVARVFPETVGQFTCLTDKNGKKIFEGDIVKNDYGYIGQIVFKACSYYIEWKSGNFTIDLYVMANSLEVIGNIHDNPELLEGKE